MKENKTEVTIDRKILSTVKYVKLTQKINEHHELEELGYFTLENYNKLSGRSMTIFFDEVTFVGRSIWSRISNSCSV
ncbi:MAG: hypothetical protein ACK5IQ_03925 [Bacteroidales bacterium]